MCGLACKDALKSLLNIDIKLKWINDLIYKDKKLGGILVESRIRGDTIELFIGIGINVNNSLSELSQDVKDIAITLKDDLLQETDIYHLSALISNKIEEYFALYENHDYDKIKALWMKTSHSIGRNISFVVKNEKKHGMTLGIDDFGALIVQDNHGQEYLLSNNIDVEYK